MVTRIGMLGASDGNGHPFSFSAIINGYCDHGLRAAGWPVIYDYVRRRHGSEFGVGDLRVTHAWTQDVEQTASLCAAARIPHAVRDPLEMIGAVDAVIIARDDHASHRPLAGPFLEAGVPVFIDKPLTLDLDELRDFAPYLERGLLMSCSGMRYARELDTWRAGQVDHGDIKLVRGTIVNGWERYGVHLLDAILPLLASRPVSVRALPAVHDSLVVTMTDGVSVHIDALGQVPVVFRIELLGSRQVGGVDITDNFSMFRRTLWEFWRQVVEERPAIPAADTIEVMRTLIAGNRALQTREEVALDGLDIS
ncbi:Gfo/Idh/MocA family protein [Halomonas maura]|uniref:Gfo/Idh/MocA family protein n=1 Tax=Halomonas maura TaxID=117606 RepID=UPI0025B398FE|nr:Gfo/Idh/MocA family oxidoreductase [Halomonas maura]MDN3555238.1 Gfo/Idh/MocA family oxidoreductase [Halomonas maura]